MIIRRNHKKHGNKRRGFSLTELAVVFGVIGAIISGIWVYAGSSMQSSKVEQSTEDISLIVDSTRAAYGGRVAIPGGPGPLNKGGVADIMPYLVDMGSFPNHLLLSVPSSCFGSTSNYANTPWGGSDNCGTLRVCAWVVGVNTQCLTNGGPNVASQFFAVEFTQLTYQSCMALATRATPTSPIPGLGDVYVNGSSGLAAGGIPITPTVAKTKCVAGSGNIVDFVYTLRTPRS